MRIYKPMSNLISLRKFDIKTAEPAIQFLHKKYYLWLVNTTDEDLSPFDDGLYSGENFISDDIALSKNNRKKNQRLLLEVEKDAEIRRANDRAEKQELTDQARYVLAKNMKKHMKKKLSEHNYVINELLRLPANFSSVINLIYNENAVFSKLSSLLESTPEMKSIIIAQANNPQFCKAINRKNMTVKDLKPALGVIGIEGLKLLMPLMFVKSRLRHECKFFPTLGAKIWGEAIVTSNTFRQMLRDIQQTNVNELQGIVAGAIIALAKTAIHKQFCSSFEEVRLSCLNGLKENNNRNLYNAMINVEHEPGLMVNVLRESTNDVVKIIVNELQWDQLPAIKIALLDMIDEKPIERCDTSGAMLSQSLYFTKYLLLRNSRNFEKKGLLKQLLYYSKITKVTCASLLAEDLRKIDIQRYIG